MMMMMMPLTAMMMWRKDGLESRGGEMVVIQ